MAIGRYTFAPLIRGGMLKGNVSAIERIRAGIKSGTIGYNTTVVAERQRLDHFAANWMLPTGGLLVTLGVGWFMSRQSTESELIDENTPSWFDYRLWRFCIRYIAPVAVTAIVISVILGHDFS